MRQLLRSVLLAGGAAAALAGMADTADAKCTRLAFSVNDYGKDGPTKDAQKLLDTYIAKWTAERGIKTYRTGPKKVTCELYLDLGVFDEHTCKAEATVCWPDGAPSKKAEGVPATITTGAISAPAATPAKPAPATKPAATSAAVKPVPAAPAPVISTPVAVPAAPIAPPAPEAPVAPPAPPAPTPVAAPVVPAPASAPSALPPMSPPAGLPDAKPAN